MKLLRDPEITLVPAVVTLAWAKFTELGSGSMLMFLCQRVLNVRPGSAV